MWSEAPESIIHGVWELEAVKAKQLPLCVKEQEGLVDDWPEEVWKVEINSIIFSNCSWLKILLELFFSP